MNARPVSAARPAATVHCFETWRVIKRLAHYCERYDLPRDRNDTPESFARECVSEKYLLGLADPAAIAPDVRRAAARYGIRFAPAPACVALARPHGGGPR